MSHAKECLYSQAFGCACTCGTAADAGPRQPDTCKLCEHPLSVHVGCIADKCSCEHAAAQLAEKEREIARLIAQVKKTENDWLADVDERAEAAEERLQEAQAEIARYRNQIALMHRQENGEVWYWADDSEDHPETLACPALIQPDVVRRFVAAEERLQQREAELGQRPRCTDCGGVLDEHNTKEVLCDPCFVKQDTHLRSQCPNCKAMCRARNAWCLTCGVKTTAIPALPKKGVVK